MATVVVLISAMKLMKVIIRVAAPMPVLAAPIMGLPLNPMSLASALATIIPLLAQARDRLIMV